VGTTLRALICNQSCKDFWPLGIMPYWLSRNHLQGIRIEVKEWEPTRTRNFCGKRPNNYTQHMWKNKLIPFAAGKFWPKDIILGTGGNFVLYSQTTGLIYAV
jgi:hypothetical protein